jgi:hypothetical protein
MTKTRKTKNGYWIRYNEFGHPYRVRLNKPLIAGILLSIILLTILLIKLN